MDIQQFIMLALTCAISFIAYLLKELKDGFNEALRDNTLEIRRTQEDLQMLAKNLPLTYVLREDFLRVVANLDTKVDRVIIDISHINENVAKLLADRQRGGDKD